MNFRSKNDALRLEPIPRISWSCKLNILAKVTDFVLSLSKWVTWIEPINDDTLGRLLQQFHISTKVCHMKMLGAKNILVGMMPLISVPRCKLMDYMDRTNK